MELHAWVDAYLDHLRVERALASNTVEAYARDLGKLCAHAESQGVMDPKGLDAPMVSTVLVVLAAEGYPDAPKLGDAITLVEEGADELIFHAGTRREGSILVTSGGRVLTACARGASVAEAKARAVALAGRLTWRGRHFREDIGAKAP